MSVARVLVTGASRRVGRAIALERARKGHDLVLTYHTREEDCRETADLCRAASTRSVEVEVLPLALDSEESIEATCHRIRPGGLDGIVHNASRYHRTPLEGLEHAELMGLFAVNAVGPLLVTSRLASSLRSSRLPGGGSVVCLGDIHASGLPRPGYAGYLASKAALHQLVQSLARELAPDVRVNGVAPGVVAFAPGDMSSSEESRYLERTPAGRSGTLEEAGQTVAWMLLDAHFVTGQVLNLCGGRSIR